MLLPALALTTTLTLTLALCPTLTTAQIFPPPPSSPPSTTGHLATQITYHQGLTALTGPGTCSAQEVSTGSLATGYCVALQTYAVSIARVQGAECVFKVFRGSAGCGGDAVETVDMPIPSGEGDVCVVTGVEDGGRFAKGSGFLVCG